MTTTIKSKQTTTRQLIAPALTAICLILMLLLRRLCPIVLIVRFPFNLIGLLVGGVGFAVCLRAQQQFRKADTNLYPFSEPEKLVTDGLFRYTRNPMYLGLTIFLAGAWIMLGALSPAAVVPAFLLIVDRWYILYEEQRLRVVFGKTYEAYQAKTPRWI